MSNWSDKAVGQINRKLEDRDQKANLFLERQRIKRAHSVPMWNAVRASIRKHLSELKESGSNALLLQVDRPNEMQVRNELDGGLLLVLSFNEETGILSSAVGSIDQEQLEVVVTEDGGVRWRY